MANPPFNQKDWRGEDELTDDARWRGYDIPPKSNANYGWILNMVSKLSDNGVAGFILANGALSGGGEEYKIRKKLIENNIIDAIVIIPRDTFYSTDISVTLWILNKNKTKHTAEINQQTRDYRERDGVLFMDLRQWGSTVEKKFMELTKDDINKVAMNYHNWQQEDCKTTYKDIPEFCYSASFDELKENDFSLVPSRYVEFVDADSGIDFNTEMKRIQQDFKTLIEEEKDSQKQLIDAFKTLGYEI
jgi:type I restriction enzyme M protein